MINHKFVAKKEGTLIGCAVYTVETHISTVTFPVSLEICNLKFKI